MKFTGAEVKAEQANRWVRVQTAAVIIAPDFVVYETSSYDVFETFLERFERAALVRDKVSRILLAGGLRMSILFAQPRESCIRSLCRAFGAF